ncbi:MAG: tRNA 5-methoxyuridine(34)/uridine 5-oxyacetic acid(34) synthase CmoB [Gammaproteobacteria bacterium]|nr:tRNA 5-methoxyuridine(34)/uridine 5-oxyacetic acid(34) synthase CmoB [Gammaproteobacteria bacterium]
MLQFCLTGSSPVIDYSELTAIMESGTLASWSEKLPAQLDSFYSRRLHGKFENWMESVSSLPKIPADRVNLDQDTVSVSSIEPLPAETVKLLEQELKLLHPWRKGPYDIHGVKIETEWRSDWKWQRLQAEIGTLQGRQVLDVGCGNGYHCWRIAGAGAELVIGIDPTQLFLAQFLAIKHFLGNRWPVHLLPLGIEDVPAELHAFDTVFSMGVLYHRRSPMDHLLELRGCLRHGGELVLETLVIDGVLGSVLVPSGRYAKMRNVWFIPSPETLVAWLQRCGFRDVRIIDISVTTTEEQQATEWMQFESLVDYLDTSDPSKTIEGYPAPKRAIICAICA